MSEWTELWENWHSVNKDLEAEVEKLDPLEASAIAAFYKTVEQEVLRPLETLENAISTGGPNPPAFSDAFKGLLALFHDLARGGVSVTGRVPVHMLNRIWRQGIAAITSFLKRHAADVMVDSWRIGATVGFPLGVSGTVTVNFRQRVSAPR